MQKAEYATATDTEITLRPRRQITLPGWACDALGLHVGDRLTVALTDQGIVFTPRKSVALKALREIQTAFAEAGITEEELQAEGRLVREELVRSRYGGE